MNLNRSMMLVSAVLLGANLPDARADFEEVSGRTWEYSVSNGEVSIVGVAPDAGELIVPSVLGSLPVTCISKLSGSNITAVTICEGVHTINGLAFRNCKNLVTVKLPTTLRTIGTLAFLNCEKLAAITLPQGIETLGAQPFVNCLSLQVIAIPSSVARILSSNIVVSDDARVCAVFMGRPPENVEQLFMQVPVNRIWTRQYSKEWQGYEGREVASQPFVLSSKVRENDPTVIDVTYIVYSMYQSVDVRALAFEDGERSFWKVVRATTFTKDEDGNDTSCNIGDGIAANVSHKLAWKVSADWKTDLAKVKFEVICSDAAQLPLKLQTIPATAKNPAITIGYNSQTDADIFNALLWYYAKGDEHLVNVDGYVDCTNVNVVCGTRWVDRTSISGERMEILAWLYDKMGYEPVWGGNLMNYIRKATRKDLWWNTGTRNCYIKSATKPANLYIGEKAYCVIDVSGGPDATSYPVTYLESEPVKGWADEYKTTKILLRRCEAGKYKMFNSKEVTLTKPFYIGVYTLTRSQYSNVVKVNSDGCNPIIVSWNVIRGDSSACDWPSIAEVDTDSFVGLIRSKTGLMFDLPSEAQWEYACRAGTSTQYTNSGNEYNDLLVTGCDTLNEYTAEVGSYCPNLWGLYDMTGNIGEWCLDKCGEISADDEVDPTGVITGDERVFRGHAYYEYTPTPGPYNGSWGHTGSYSTTRSRWSAVPSQEMKHYTGKKFYLGFRLSMTQAE